MFYDVHGCDFMDLFILIKGIGGKRGMGKGVRVRYSIDFQHMFFPHHVTSRYHDLYCNSWICSGRILTAIIDTGLEDWTIRHLLGLLSPFPDLAFRVPVHF